MQRHARPLARTLDRAHGAQTSWVVGALLASLVLAAASGVFAGALTGPWTMGSLAVLAGAAGCLGLALRRD